MNTRVKMATVRDVYMAANLLMKKHGVDATIFAAMAADSLAERVTLRVKRYGCAP